MLLDDISFQRKQETGGGGSEKEGKWHDISLLGILLMVDSRPRYP